MRERVPSVLPAQRVQIFRGQFCTAIADDLFPRDVEDIDAPAGFGGEQVRSDAQQVIGVAIGPFGNGPAGANIPIAVGISVYRQYRFRFLTHGSR